MAEYRHLDDPHRDDLVVHDPCGAILTPRDVPRHTCHPTDLGIIARLRSGEPPEDSTPQITARDASDGR
jgi:hypothetical protein